MGLVKITESVGNVCEAIASVVGVDVTVVDKNLIRTNGTGIYKKCIGEQVSSKTAFGIALRSGESFIIEQARKHRVCYECEKIDNCKEFAEVCCPILLDGDVVGVIGLIAFDERQSKRILANKQNLMNFLKKMADLLATKLTQHNQMEKIELLAKKLEIVINSMEKGVIFCNLEGEILSYNNSFLEIFKLNKAEIQKYNIKNIIGDNNFNKIKTNHKNKEFTYNSNVCGIFDCKSILIDKKDIGKVFVFSKLSDVLNTVNSISTGTIVTTFDEIIGKSIAISEVKEKAQKASISTSTVAIQGESGTGKELFARAIHYSSQRSKCPFIAVNCSAIPEHLLESELFGYQEGAFTGAKKGGKEGKFLLASGGTIFLDEIGDMPLHLQSKLLRVLQEGMIEKIGGNSSIPTDIRVITATNKDLEKMVQENEFRDDLFYRINVIPLIVPPLRERIGDIHILVEHLMEKCNKKLQKNITSVGQGVMDIFLNYSWPGNVRELENTIEYAINMCNGDMIEETHLPKRIFSSVGNIGQKDIIPIKQLEQREISKALEQCHRNNLPLTEAAKALGISKATLYRKIKQYNL